MIDVVIPCVDSAFFELSETMRSVFWKQFASLADKKLVLITDREMDSHYHAKELLEKEASGCKVIVLEGRPQGSLCTSLLGIAEMGKDVPLLICEASAYTDTDLSSICKHMNEEQADAELLTFACHESDLIYVKKENNEITEAAEGRQISDQAAAGMYFYAKSSLFIESAEKAIMKGSSYKNEYYLSASINEMILDGRKIQYTDMDSSAYHRL